MAGIRHSRQRDAVLDELCSRSDHPTADELFLALRERIPNISLATIYRNLALLADEGIILRLNCDGVADHFDATTSQHYHLFCKKCKKLCDIEMPEIDMLNSLANTHYDGIIESHSVTFFGICENCHSNK
ncbi:MAG: transcriptional repressor [Oscillospiraceae bacterium]